MNRHILVIGGFAEMHKKLKDCGANLTLMVEADKLQYWNFKDGDKSIYNRIIGISKDASEEEWINVVKNIDKYNKIFAIGAYHEMNQDIAVKIAQYLNLECNSLNTIENVRNKYKMREKLRKSCIDNIISSEVSSEEDIRDFIKNYGYPVILKPVDGWASLGVSIIRSDDEIKDAVRWFGEWASESKMYVEQFIHGEEYSVEAISENGIHKIVCITKKLKDEKHFIELGHVVPADLNTKDEILVMRFVEEVLTELGVASGGSHTEVIISNDGPHIVEVHTRLGGDCIPDLVRISTGIDLVDLWAKQTLGESILPKIPREITVNKYSAIKYISPNATGVLKSIEGKESIESMENIIKLNYIQTPGSEVRGVYDSFSRSAYIISTGYSEESAMLNAEEASKKVRFIISC